jgi:spermidine synthase
MLYEVAWSRGLTLVMGSSTYAFSIMLTTFLVGLFLGSFLMARWVDRFICPVLVLGILQISIGLSAFGGLYLFPQLPLLFLLVFSVLGSTPTLLSLGEFLLTFLVMFLPTLLLGGVFPLVVKICTTTLHKLGHLVGKAYALNTLGTIVGAFATGFILLPTLGIRQSILLALSLNVAMGLGLFLTSVRGRIPVYAATGLVMVLAVLALVYPPAWDPLIMSSGGYRDAPRYLQMYRSPADLFSRITTQYKTLFYQEGVTATVAVVERPSLDTAPTRTLSIDGKVDASTGTDMATQVLSGHLPLLFSPQAEEVLVISFASGVTVGAVTRYPVREIVAVEIEPAVMEASRFFETVNHRPLQDCRVKMVLNDARNYLLVTPQQFDVIISEPSNPWMSGPAKLFTREFFQLGKEHLKPGGIFTQWLQLYGLEPVYLKTLVRTFQSVFPAVRLFQPSEGDLLLLGSEQEWQVPFLQMARRMAEPGIANDLRRVGIHTIYDLLVTFRLGTKEIEAYTGEGPYNTDENGLIEFAAPQSLYADTLAANQDEIQQATRGVVEYIQHIGELTDQQDFFLRLAFHYLSQDRLREAETSVRKAMTLGPSATGYWILGEIALREGREVEALSAWRRGLELEPTHFATLLTLVLYYQQQKEYPQAERFLTRLDVHYADNALVRYYRGINRYFQGDYQAAVADLETAVHRGFAFSDSTAEVSGNSSFPREEYFLLPELPDHQLAYYYLSLAYAKLGETSQAAVAHERFLSDLEQWRKRGEQEPAVLTQSKLWQRLQTAPEHEITPEEKELAQWIAQEVGEPLALYYHGVTLYLLGYYTEAVTKLSQMLTLLENQQKSLLTHYYLGLAYHQLHQFSQAKTHLEVFLRDLQDEEEMGYQRAEVQRRLSELSVE